jgi:hypothetical protein
MLGKLSEVDQEHRGYLRLAAPGRITDAELDDARLQRSSTPAKRRRKSSERFVVARREWRN